MAKNPNASRRTFLKTSAMFGAGMALAACAPGAPAPAAPAATSAPAGEAAVPPSDLWFDVAPEALNPLGLEAGTPVEGIFFEGGYGREYIDHAADIFRALHPENEMSVEGIQRLGEQLRPRFIAGDPPDVIDNSGAGNLDTTGLVAEEQLADLAALMSAASLDTPGATFADTLFPGSQADGVYDGRQLHLSIAYTVFGIWNSSTLMQENGWEIPATWDEFMGLCETIKGAGMNPWTYQGRFPQYMVFGVLMPLIYKIGGIQPIINIDNLEDGAWQDPAVVQAVQLMAQLHENEFIMPGTEGLTHTEAQAEWLQGNAVFLPCGTWLENEMRELTPEDFNMTVHAVPTVEGGAGSAEAIYANSGEIYFVPSQAKNVTGGIEFMRCMLSRESAKYFAQNVSSIMPVVGGTEGIEVSSAMQSALAAVESAGDDIFNYRFSNWYIDLSDGSRDRTGDLLTGRISSDEFVEAMQEIADQVKSDPDIQKYSREA
ncbi:MAG: N-acetylglucosamine/diacetylchitobiose ABC transporter substrate-binding protein [Litorilinea sp.]